MGDLEKELYLLQHFADNIREGNYADQRLYLLRHIERALAALPKGEVDDTIRAALIAAGCTSLDGTFVHASMRDVLAALPKGEPVADYFGGLVDLARLAAAKASAKFPQPNYVTLKIAEEAGEVVRGAVHYAEGRMEWSEVEGEIVQLLAMLIRFVMEGDQINGVTPPAAPPAGDER